MNKILLGALVASILVLTIVLTRALTSYVYVTSTGYIIYPRELKATPDLVDWGNVSLNETVPRGFFLENIGSAPVENLTMYVANVTGLLNFNLTWSLEGETIYPGDILEALILLTVYDAVGDTFTLTMGIAGEP